jgi:hypothetical protein
MMNGTTEEAERLIGRASSYGSVLRTRANVLRCDEVIASEKQAEATQTLSSE